MKNKMKNSDGFTLAELMAALMIIAIRAAVSAPAIMRYPIRMKMMRRNNRQQKGFQSPWKTLGGFAGFTIIELMVVIAIIGALAVASHATMQLASRPAVHQAVNYVMADLIAARNEAIKGEESCNVNFNFPPAAPSYTYNMPTSGKTKTVFLGERFRNDVFFLAGSPGGADPAPTNALTFSPRGILTDPLAPCSIGSGQVYLTDQTGIASGAGKVYRIIISGSGEVEAQVRDYASAVWFEFN